MLKARVNYFYPFIFVWVLILSGCTTDYSNREPIGKVFPTVSGQTLTGEKLVFPQTTKGRQVVLLLGYVQNAQFDIYRWLIGLDMTKTQVDVYELPTIQGQFPRFFKTQIDEGMRKGISKELWKGVVTIYQYGETVQKFTGNINANNARVLLLDEQGSIIFFYDEGFSVTALNQLRHQITINI